MSIRASLALLMMTSLVMLLLQTPAICRSLQLQDGRSEPKVPNRQDIAGVKTQGGDLDPGPATPNQTPTQADPRTEQVKRTVRRIGLASKITVFLKNGDDLHGAVTALDQDKFEVAEIDLHQLITVEYKDVKKVRKGYGGLNLFTGRRTSQPRWVVPAITIALLGMLIVPLFFLRD